jgi:hypothetical protein
MSPFVTWKTKRVPKGAVLTDLQGVEQTFEMTDGESYQDRFPADAHFRFDPDYKRDIQPLDFYLNVDNMLVCSERAMAFIRSQQPPAVEYLPVTLLDHKRKPVPAPHFIIHPVDHPDCIDVARSDVTWAQSDPGVIQFAEHVEIDPARVPEDRLLFRPRSFPKLTLMRRAFAEAIVAQGFSGARWVETR